MTTNPENTKQVDASDFIGTEATKHLKLPHNQTETQADHADRTTSQGFLEYVRQVREARSATKGEVQLLQEIDELGALSFD